MSYAGKIRSLSLLAALLFITPAANGANAAGEILVLRDADSYQASGKFYVTKEFREVKDPREITETWDLIRAQTPSYGFTDAAYWARITLRSENDGDWFIVVPAPRLSEIRFFAPQMPAELRIIETGIRKKFSERPFPNRKFVFPVSLKKGENFTCYLRIRSETSLQIPLQVWRPEAFRNFDVRENLIFGLILGAHLLLLVYNLAIAFFLRSSVFFLYSGVVFSGILLFSTTYGFAYQFFWPDYPRFGLNINAVAIGLFGIFGAHFTRQTLGTLNWKWINRALWYGPILTVLPLAFLPFVSYGNVVRMMIIAGISLFIPILFALILGLRERRPATWYFLSAILSFGAGAVAFAFVTLGIIPSTPVSQFGFIIGATGAITILSIALASQVRTFKIEREAAVAADRFKSEFLSVMSHEIRTPLTAMVGLAQLLTDDLPAAERVTYARALRESGSRLAHLVSQVLDFSRIEEGRLTLEETPFDLQDILNNLLDLFRPAAVAKGLAISAENSAGPGLFLGDAARISQVLTNLIANAIKFTERGTVTIYVSKVPLPENIHGANVRFAVADTGIGVSPEKRRMIFESFVQADAGITRRYGGSGLGLAIASGIVSLMAGKIEVAENAGGGTVFSFTLVLKYVRDTVTVPEIPQPTRLSYRVLVAEDDEINRMLVEHILGQDNHLFDSAANGLEALSLLKEREYDLALIDLQMPEMDGYTTVRQARLLTNSNSRIPIYALSANALPSDLAACREAGFTGHIAKPYNPQELLQIVQLAGRGLKTRASFAEKGG